MLPTDLTPSPKTHGGTRRRRTTRRRVSIPWAQAGVLIILCAGIIAALVFAVRSNFPPLAASDQPVPAVSAVPIPLTTVRPIPVPTPAPTSDPEGVSYDFTQPAPETAPVEDSWFDDAVFIGDSRTDGLRLYGGIPGATFLEHTGITVFEVSTKKVIKVSGEKYTVLDALALKQYGKVFLMLGVNELGYFDDAGFQTAYGELVDAIRTIQPEAVIYLQNLPPINPEKAEANSQPYYVTNEQIAVYNGIIAEIAAEKKTVLVDMAAALSDENGVLPREGTSDGVHFTKEYYSKWHAYLNKHTVDSERYWAGQTLQ